MVLPNPPFLVASKVIPVGSLPWGSEGHVPRMSFDLDLESWAVDLKSETPRLQLQSKFSKVLSVGALI
jgi:hypothetical protein